MKCILGRKHLSSRAFHQRGVHENLAVILASRCAHYAGYPFYRCHRWGAFFYGVLPRIPSFAGLIDGFQTPIQIYVTAPESGAVFPANAAIRVHAEIWSEEPILSYELWVNGVQQANPPTGQTEGFPLQVEWLWTPGSEDVYSLLVKATDAEGGSSLSPTVRITASEPVGAQLFLPLEPGEDPQAAAEAAGLDPEGIALQEAQPGSPAGAFIVYDIPPVESSSPDPASVPCIRRW